MSDVVLAAIIAATVTLIPTTGAALWRWAKAVEDRAYERARNENLLREAQAAITQKNSELDAVKGQLTEKDRIIATQQATIDWITAEAGS